MTFSPLRTACRAVQRGRAGVTQVEQTRGRAALGLPTGGLLDGLGAPVCTHVGEDLRRVGQQVAEQHRGTVQRVVLGGHDGGLADAGPVEVRVEDGLQNVAVGEVVGPLALALEACHDGTVADDSVVQNGGPHTDEGAAFHFATVQRDIMSYGQRQSPMTMGALP